MDTYRNALQILYELFRLSGNTHWQKWIGKSIYEWENESSVSHFKAAFGGMGSINDQLVGDSKPEGIWRNTLSEEIQNLAYSLAIGKNVTIRRRLITSLSLQGTHCEGCGCDEVDKGNIEQYLSTQFTPLRISEMINSDEYLSLLDVNSMMHSADVEKLRRKVIDETQAANIGYCETLRNWRDTCPKCSGTKKAIFGKKIILTSDDDNNLDNKDVRLTIVTLKPWYKFW